MKQVRIIASDLDGTLINSKEELSTANLDALMRAAAEGIEFVPATGRFYESMPDVIKDLEFVNYAITCNGAEVYDVRNKQVIFSANIPMDRAVEAMEFLDGYPILYYCYMDNAAWITAKVKEEMLAGITDDLLRNYAQKACRPVPDLKQFIRDTGHDVQKIIALTADIELREIIWKILTGDAYADFTITSAFMQNIEINAKDANKGYALKMLADHLKVDMEETMALGDGTNDTSMIVDAGLGIAMENAAEEVKAAADYITASIAEDGVAKAIDTFCLGN